KPRIGLLDQLNELALGQISLVGAAKLPGTIQDWPGIDVVALFLVLEDHDLPPSGAAEPVDASRALHQGIESRALREHDIEVELERDFHDLRRNQESGCLVEDLPLLLTAVLEDELRMIADRVVPQPAQRRSQVLASLDRVHHDENSNRLASV